MISVLLMAGWLKSILAMFGLIGLATAGGVAKTLSREEQKQAFENKHLTINNMDTSKWIGALHFTKGRQGYKPEYVAIHITDGATIAGTDAWFNDPRSSASAHSGIGEHGEVHDYVHSDDTAWHAGINNKSECKWEGLKLVGEEGFINPNLYTLGLEHAGHPSTEISEAQYAASAQKLRFWFDKFGIPMERERLVPHSDIYNGHANCPNGAINLDKLFDLMTKAEAIYPEGYVPPPIA